MWPHAMWPQCNGVGYSTQACLSSSITKSTRLWMPNQYHHFGKLGEDGSRTTAAATTMTTPSSSQEVRAPYVNSSNSSSKAQSTSWHGATPIEKRMGAAAFRALGGSLTTTSIWARWQTPRQAARYAAHPPAWHLPARVVLPRPTGRSGNITRESEWSWIKVRELCQEDALKLDKGRKKGQRPPTVEGHL